MASSRIVRQSARDAEPSDHGANGDLGSPGGEGVGSADEPRAGRDMEVALAAILAPERVRCHVPTASRKRTLEELGAILAGSDPELSAQAVLDRLIARERLGSTGLGEGCALPHARVPGLRRTLAAFLRLQKGVDFDSPDREPVDLFFGLLVPEDSTDEHLEILAAIARLLSDETVRRSIRAAEDPARVREVLLRNGSTD